MSSSLECIAALPGHQDRAWHVAWNPVQPLLASCSSDKSVRLYSYNISTPGHPDFKLATSIPTGHSRTVRNIAWSPSGKSFATASFDSTVGIWEKAEVDAEDGDGAGAEWECISTLEGHESECKSVGYSFNGSLLASCSRDKSVWVWEVQEDADFECMSVLMEHSQDVKAIAWHPKEEILASASYDDTIKLYLDDPSDDWYAFATLTGHESTVWSIDFSPDGEYLASGSDDLSVKIWKRFKAPPAKNAMGGIGGGGMEKWECQLTIPKVHERTVFSVSWGVGVSTPGPNGDISLGWLATASGDGAIKVHDILKESDALPLRHTLIASKEAAHGGLDVNSVAWCPREGHENLLASAGDDDFARVWQISV